VARAVFVHAGAADNRMWDDVTDALDDGIEVELHELRGFGSTPVGEGPIAHVDDLEARLTEPTALVGASFGGLLCMEAAVRRPQQVTALVLLDALLFDHAWSPQLQAIDGEENRLLGLGDVEGAASLNARAWARYGTPEVQRKVFEMQRNAFELQLATPVEQLAPATIDLASIKARTLVVWGERDWPDFVAISERLAREIEDAETAVVEGAGHLPALERPEAVAGLLNDFLQRQSTI
jgi:pimeloyl-ACP methyl ester carboxylesterase